MVFILSLQELQGEECLVNIVEDWQDRETFVIHAQASMLERKRRVAPYQT
jgi:hypothetical protein